MGDRRRSTRVLADPEHVAPPFLIHPVDADGDGGDPVGEAVEAGRAEGYREGSERAARELALELDRIRGELADALGRLADLEARLTRRFETRVIEIAIEAASRIVRQRLDADDPLAARALEEALGSLPEGVTVRARLNPDDLASIEEHLRVEIESERLKLVADSGIHRGGAIVESEAGRVDATLETAEAAVCAAAVGEEVAG